jgi:hypothetical protein
MVTLASRRLRDSSQHSLAQQRFGLLGMRCAGVGTGVRVPTTAPRLRTRARAAAATARASARQALRVARGDGGGRGRGHGHGDRPRALPMDDRDDRARAVEVIVDEVTRDSLPTLQSEQDSASLVSTPTDEKVLSREAIRSSVVRLPPPSNPVCFSCCTR